MADLSLTKGQGQASILFAYMILVAKTGSVCFGIILYDD